MMTRSLSSVRHGQFQEQILLERALFCVGCEVIFTGNSRCPRCSSGETVWPLAEWLRSVRSTATTLTPRLRSSADGFPTPYQQRTPSAA